MVDWEDAYKRYVTRKYEEVMGEPLPIGNIKIHDVEVDIDLSLCGIEELVYMYAFAVMKEHFEQVEKIKTVLLKKNCEVKIDIDDNEKTAIINAYVKPNVSIAYVDIKMVITPNGMMIDFEEDN
jgi:hypothetical protein